MYRFRIGYINIMRHIVINGWHISVGMWMLISCGLNAKTSNVHLNQRLRLAVAVTCSSMNLILLMSNQFLNYIVRNEASRCCFSQNFTVNSILLRWYGAGLNITTGLTLHPPRRKTFSATCWKLLMMWHLRKWEGSFLKFCLLTQNFKGYGVAIAETRTWEGGGSPRCC